MISSQQALDSVGRCLDWLERVMLAGDRGSRGVYERVRTDKKEVVRLCRPDVASEYLRLLYDYADLTGDNRFDDVYQNVKNWLLNAQKKRGYFPFYLNEEKQNAPSKMIYQNDNGKVILNLVYLYQKTGDMALLLSAKKCADFWLKCQLKNGDFYTFIMFSGRKYSKGPCFLLWMAAGLICLGKVTADKKYTTAGYRAFSCVRLENGRIKTTFEVSGGEAWRPLSSENFIALLCYALAYMATDDKRFIDAICAIYPFCRSMIDLKSGAIKNNVDGIKASLNNNENISDFVYTMGYGVNALFKLAEISDFSDALEMAQKVCEFIIKTQCNEDDATVDGAWRGSYDIITAKPKGRCNQQNSLDEGGEFSVYSGWCAIPIAIGLIRLARINGDEKSNK